MSKHKYTNIERSILYLQVNGKCPLDNTIFKTQKKNNRTTYNFECAHIYPEFPSLLEKELLKNEEMLSENVNDLNNIIALCPTCHTKYDSNKTVEEYRILYKIKKQAILQDNIDSFFSFPVEQELFIAAKKMYEIDSKEMGDFFNYIPLKLENKIPEKENTLLLAKVKLLVSGYFVYLQKIFKSQEITEKKFMIICSEIKTFYLKVANETKDKSIIFNSIIQWLISKNISNNREVMEIITSFFIQNCEIFEERTDYVAK